MYNVNKGDQREIIQSLSERGGIWQKFLKNLEVLQLSIFKIDVYPYFFVLKYRLLSFPPQNGELFLDEI